MKKALYTLILVLLFLKVGNTQTFDFYRISPAVVNGDTGISALTATKAIYKNTGSTNLNFKFARIVNNLPPTWTSSMCAGVNCYSPILDTVPPPPPAPSITLGAGLTDTFYLDVTGQTIGTGTMVIKVWVNNNPSIFKIDTFKVHLGPVGIKKISSVVEGYLLEQNYPNPFNPSTKINFSLPVRENVSLKVYDILGNEVARLINSEKLEAGSYTYDFDTKNYNLSSGVYYYVIRTDNFVASKKMILMK
jgi:hypothetical protein